MESGILTKYSASAGSGKTYKLTAIYLEKLFRSKYAYRKILAVTFTNKAASDMKRKILSQLCSMAAGKRSDMADQLSEDTGKSTDELTREAGEILENILHDYSRFTVGTIDSFFQKVLKSFTREIGLQQGYIIELDHSLILKNAVTEVLENSGKDRALGNWITEFAHSRIDAGKSWNLKDDIIRLAAELFREKFKLIPEEERKKLGNREFLMGYIRELRSLNTDFEKKLAEYSDRCSEILARHNVEESMFLRGGVPSFLQKMKEGSNGAFRPMTDTVSRVLETPPVWSAKTGPSVNLRKALDDGFGDLFTEAARYYRDRFVVVNTSVFILENIYILGILADILDHVHAITTSENRFLLSDAGELLWQMISNDQVPFIFEKTGNTWENFMIDEFQDTSLIQWNNFRPLIENSMAEGHDDLVVGDVKQSIYRWRNSDWTIFGALIHRQFAEPRIKVEHLAVNWRSLGNIITFNNSLFSVMPGLIDMSEKNNTGTLMLSSLYSDALQDFPQGKDGGNVRIEFIGDTEKSFKEKVLARLPGLIEDLQDRGYSGADIGILVRTNDDGAEVLKSLLEYNAKEDETKRKKYNYSIISNESLLLSASPVINFIISLLTGLYNPEDRLCKALMLENWVLATGRDPLTVDLSDLENECCRQLPERSSEFIGTVRRMSLFEAVENIILFFGLGIEVRNTPYLNSFQDYVLEFAGTTSPDIPSFLEWWNTTGIKKSIILTDQSDSMRVMTIHKSKGLEFRVVIVPFISWDLGHGRKNPVMWLSPEKEPFSKLGLVPVKYKADLRNSQFAADYYGESYYALVDNLNLLYVAFTRAIDCIYGFCPAKPESSSIASALYKALNEENQPVSDKPVINLESCMDSEKNVFSYGDAGKNATRKKEEGPGISPEAYYVNSGPGNLHLKFHGENWLLEDDEERKSRINYGKLMHGIFESIITLDDIPHAVNKLVLEGTIPETGRADIERRVSKAVARPEVRDWFKPGLEVMNESEILTAGGTTRRPDRVIISGDKAIVVDFKFGEEKKEYLKQVSNYRNLLLGMDYKVVDAFLWYVDNDKVIGA